MKVFALNHRLSRDSNADPEDVLNVKRALNAAGFYPIPEIGLADFPDKALFNGITKFQASHGLKADGILKPGGETEEELNHVLQSANDESEKDRDTSRTQSARACRSVGKIEARIQNVENQMNDTGFKIEIAKLRGDQEAVKRLKRMLEKLNFELVGLIAELRKCHGISRSSRYLNILGL